MIDLKILKEATIKVLKSTSWRNSTIFGICFLITPDVLSGLIMWIFLLWSGIGYIYWANKFFQEAKEKK